MDLLEQPCERTRPRILFVDDDELMLRALSRMLSADRDRWDMTFVRGGCAGIAELGAREFDVVITDLDMPVTDGFAVLEAAREKAPRAARIMLTGSQLDPGDVDAVVIYKPCPRAELRSLLDRMTQRAL